MTFEDLNLIEPIIKAVRKKGYIAPTPIQKQSIPVILEGKDILACAQTGTGKTAAFAIPIIQLLQNKLGNGNQKPSLKSLIITPTRELAIQISENINTYGRHTDIRQAVIFGGVKQGRQVEALRKGVHILIATPGRLLDLIQQNIISLREIELFVLDEADRMLDMGFINDIKKVIAMLPKQRQSLFFSATMPGNIVSLSKTILNNPVKVEVTPASSTAETVKQYAIYTNRTLKNDVLIHLLTEKNIDQALVFSRTKHGADRIARRLKKQDIKAAAIHGDKQQNQRQKVLKQFKDGQLTVLVATDIAARGIDIDKLKYVINFDVPNVPETYVHRIGRAGRAGEEGISFSIAEPEENAYLKDVQKLIGKDKITIISDHPFPQTDKPMTDAERKEWNKEKQRRKQEFFAQRKAQRQGGGRGQGKPNKKNGNKDKNRSPKNKRNNDRNKENTTGGEKDNQGNKNKADNKKKHHSKKRSNKDENPRKRGYSQNLKDKFNWPLE